jgi:hypothetical protein
MEVEYPPSPLLDISPLIMGLALDPKYTSVLHFLWAALRAEESLYRFINLAVCIELLVRFASPIKGSVHPCCGDPKCGFILEKCPKCERPWTMPTQLRERAGFILDDPQVLSSFIKSRNDVFHGRDDDLHHEYSEDLHELNTQLFLRLRNYIGAKMGLPPVTATDLSLAVNPPDITATVFYTEAPKA